MPEMPTGNLSAREMKEAIDSGLPGLTILDVRTAAEFERGRIPGAVLMNIADPSFPGRIEALDRDKPYLLYCKAGVRSAAALGYMKTLGFEKVAHLAGGIGMWMVEGYPLDR